jgi:hypothetical protein
LRQRLAAASAFLAGIRPMPTGVNMGQRQDLGPWVATFDARGQSTLWSPFTMLPKTAGPPARRLLAAFRPTGVNYN